MFYMENDRWLSQHVLRARIGTRLEHLWNTPPDVRCAGPWLPFLSFASRLYQKALRHAQKHATRQASLQHLSALVISVGNLVTGGTGKTPVSLWLADYFERHGWRVAVLSRGYGRKHQGVARVDATPPLRPQVLRFGDEPVLMATRLAATPVWVGPKRALTGQAAIQTSGAEILILDDGFQHLGLHRDLDLVLMDVSNPWGNGWLLPLGPLREPVDHLKRAHAFILTHAEDGERTQQLRSSLQQQFQEKPIFCCRHRPTALRCGLQGPTIPLDALRKQPVVAFAGIAQPTRFFQTLRTLGVRLAAHITFPDHYCYRAQDLRALLDAVMETEARFLLTTEKDAVRLPETFQELLVTVRMDIDFGEDHDYFSKFLAERVARLSPGTSGNSRQARSLRGN